MRGKTRLPFTKTVDPNRKLVDADLKKVVRDLESLQHRDFPLHKKWIEIETKLSPVEIKTLRLCKLLYCIDHRKEVFLHLGIIVESKLNSIVKEYISRGWRTPGSFSDAPTQTAKFDQFLNKKTLNEKADMINSLNLFNNQDASDRIRHKIQAFRFLRNYGGHSKSVNDFFQTVIDSQPDCDSEIEEAFNLIKLVDAGLAQLNSTPPSPL